MHPYYKEGKEQGTGFQILLFLDKEEMGRGLVAKKWLDMNYESLENFTSASGFLCWSAWNTEKHRDCQEHRFDTLFYKNFECFSLRKITQQSPYIAIYHNVWVLHRTKSFCIN